MWPFHDLNITFHRKKTVDDAMDSYYLMANRSKTHNAECPCSGHSALSPLLEVKYC